MGYKKPVTIEGGPGQSGLMERIQSGDLIDPATLGTGVANNTTFLRGDGTWAPAGGGGSGSNLLLDFVAQANINQYDIVTSDGFIADSAIIAYRGTILGLATTNVAIGFAGQAIGFGKVQNVAWGWVPGDKLYLNGTTLSTISPAVGFAQTIATATAADTIDVKIGRSVLL